MNRSNIFQPNWASAPGNTIIDILEERGISAEGFASELNETVEFVDDLVQGSVAITIELASKLENILGASSDFWIKRESKYREDLLRLAKDKEEEWVKSLPIKDMISYGWLTETKDILAACLEFFNVSSIAEWQLRYTQEVKLAAFRTSAVFESKLGAVATWLRQGEIQANELHCEIWNEDLFAEKLDEIKTLTRIKDPKDFIPKLVKLCAECGVAVVIVRTPNGCRASGATKFINSQRALLMLSFRYLSDDQFWFTFFHEAGHLLLHGNKGIFIEGTDGSKEEEEKEANTFAGEVLIPFALQSQLSRLKRTKRDIINFAITAGVSPGIVVGQMQHYNIIDKSYLNSYKRRYDWAEIMN